MKAGSVRRKRPEPAVGREKLPLLKGQEVELVSGSVYEYVVLVRLYDSGSGTLSGSREHGGSGL